MLLKVLSLTTIEDKAVAIACRHIAFLEDPVNGHGCIINLVGDAHYIRVQEPYTTVLRMWHEIEAEPEGAK